MAARVNHLLVVARLLTLVTRATPPGLEVLPDIRLRLDNAQYQRDLLIVGSDALADALAADAFELPPNSVRMAVGVVSPSSFSDTVRKSQGSTLGPESRH